MGLKERETIAQFELGKYKNFVYLVLDWDSRAAAIVDPQTDVDTPLAALERHGLRLETILLTHTHHDHIAGVPELLRRFPKLSLRVHERDARRLSEDARARATPVADGERIAVGGLSLKALHTPGHSSGECCYFLEGAPPYLLTGDTIFIRDCGRTDLESGSTSEMFASLQLIRRLPPSTVILPGHHYKPECASTLERELKESPPFGCRSVQELEALP